VAAGVTTIGSNVKIGRGPSFSTISKSATVRPVTGRPLRPTTTASMRTSSTPAEKVGGSCARPGSARATATETDVTTTGAWRMWPR